MGLDINVAGSDKSYHAGYGALHLVRWLALVQCGFPEKIAGESSFGVWPTCYVLPEGFTGKMLSDLMLPLQVAGHHYPNLLLHCDSEGSYSRRGKVDTGTLMTGNSVGLLAELECLMEWVPERLKQGNHWTTLKMLHGVVEAAVKNGDGRVEFH